MTREEYFQRWAQLHGDLDPRTSLPVQVWLSVTYVLAKPLAAARLSPDAVTLLGLLVALSVPFMVARGWLLAAAVAALASGILDNLDGAVAVMTSRSSDWGYVLDSVTDRVADTALLLALGMAGGVPWVGAAAAFLALMQEYVRARAAGVGFSQIGVISLSERPTRVIVTGMFLLAAVVEGPVWAAAGAWVATALGAVGSAQVMWSVHSRFRG